MKKAALIVSVALAVFFAPANVASTFVSYAYLPADVVLFDASGASVCTLPATYFVLLGGDAENGRYPVAYADISGYVRVADVQTVDYEPVTKYAARTARPDNDGMAVNLRAAPNTETGSILCTVPNGTELTLYGAREGAELFAGAGTLWQFVRYEQDGNALYGYVYAAQLKYDPVVPNKIEKVEPPAAESPITQTPASLNLTRAGMIALAAAMCVPAGVLMLVLFYRPDSKRTPRHAQKDR